MARPGAEEGFGGQGKEDLQGDGRLLAPGPRERRTCQLGGVPGPQLLFSMTGLEVARSHLRRSWEGGAAPAAAAALGAGRLQMSLAPAPWAGAARHRCEPPAAGLWPPSCGGSCWQRGRGCWVLAVPGRNARLGRLGRTDGHATVRGEEVCDGLLPA